MKKTVFVLLAALAAAAAAGQNIALGERAPEPKVQCWLDAASGILSGFRLQ